MSRGQLRFMNYCMHLPEIQPLEDPQNECDARPTHPFRMAARNAAAALLGIGLAGGALWLKVHWRGGDAPTAWWIWGAVAAFAIGICFFHAFIASRYGARRAGVVLKCVIVAALAGMLLGLWWYLQPKD